MFETIAELYRKYPIMQQLETFDVFTVEENGDAVCVRECADDCFSMDITKEDAQNISKFFDELSKAMK